MTLAGTIVGFSQESQSLVELDSDGSILKTSAIPVRCAHGMTVSNDRGEALWIADIGITSEVRDGVRVRTIEQGGVVRVDRDGRLLDRLDPPPGYDGETAYVPTGVVVDEVRAGGTGEVWVADGYGQSLVHRYSRGGDYVATIDGDGGAGRFDCPHAITIDRRRSEPELLVADRANGRVQVYDLTGHFKRVFGDTFLSWPSAFAFIDDLLVIADLQSRLTLVDAEDRLVGHIGDPTDAHLQPDWPNAVDDQGRIVPPDRVLGRLISPHGLAASAAGTIFIAEWLVGGRVVALERQTD